MKGRQPAKESVIALPVESVAQEPEFLENPLLAPKRKQRLKLGKGRNRAQQLFSHRRNGKTR
jgi:hypothetical protein